MDRAQAIREIKSRLRLSTVVGERVKLRGRSPNFMGLCPFHQEKTPSFHVRDQVMRFKCFGCGVSGDVFEYLMRIRGISFVEAVEELSLKAGIISLAKSAPALKTQKEENTLSAQKAAQEYFVQELLKTPVAFLYVNNQRGLSELMIKQAGIGFGGSSKDHFFSFMKKKNISDELMLKSGLLKVGRFSTATFLNRITFPIRNHDGVIIGFGGRAFLKSDQDVPKYVNTHSYAHYEKRKSFYGWFESLAALQKGAVPVLVEGYFDAMALWAAGMPALALCGTSLSLDHVKLLRSMSSRLILCFDKDNAGINALRQALVFLYRMNIEPSLLVLDEKDAGEYLQKKQLRALKQRLENVTDAMCYLIDQAAALAQQSVAERVRQIDMLMPILVSMKRPLIRRQYAAYLAKGLHEEPAVLWSEIEQKSKSIKAPISDGPSVTPMKQLSSADRLALEIALSDPSLIAAMANIFEHLSSDIKDLLNAFGKCYEAYPKAPVHVLLKKTAEMFESKQWPSIVAVLQNRIVLTKAEALTSLNALKEKFARQNERASIENKRLELLNFVRKKDYPAVLSSLKEKSDLVRTRNRKIPRVKAFLEDSKLNEPKITDLAEHGSFFDATEDW